MSYGESKLQNIVTIDNQVPYVLQKKSKICPSLKPPLVHHYIRLYLSIGIIHLYHVLCHRCKVMDTDSAYYTKNKDHHKESYERTCTFFFFE